MTAGLLWWLLFKDNSFSLIEFTFILPLLLFIVNILAPTKFSNVSRRLKQPKTLSFDLSAKL